MEQDAERIHALIVRHAHYTNSAKAQAILADWAHLVAGGLWIGGLVQLGFILPSLLRDVEPTGRRRLLASLAPRFSWLGGLSVATLVLTGFYAGLLYVPSWAALLDTPYGAVLSGKLLLVVPLVLLGAINLLVFHPRFRRAGRAAGAQPDDAGGRRAFRLVVLGEVALAAAVLAVTGVLTGTPPASSLPTEGRPYAATQRAGQTSVTLEVRPNQAGDNLLAVTLAGPQGAPASASRVRLTLTMLDMEMGVREVEARPVEPGRYEVSGGYLSMAGNWRADVAIQQAGGEQSAAFTFNVGPAPGANRPAFSPARILLLTLFTSRDATGIPVNPQTLFALVAIGCGVVMLVRLRGLRGRTARRQTRLVAAGLFVVGLTTGAFSVASAYQRSLPNPVPADAASLARGRAVYQANCAACHGDEGRGDGLAGRALRPRRRAGR